MLLGLEKNWKHVKTVKQAQDAARKMHHTLPEWKLKDCVKLLCGDIPILGAARASQVAEAAAPSLAELMGGVMGLRFIQQLLRKVQELLSLLVFQMPRMRSNLPQLDPTLKHQRAIPALRLPWKICQNEG